MKTPTKKLAQGEFIALMAALVAMVAFSTDAMLPAFPEIAAELSPDNVNKAQLIVTSFLLGMGIGTLVMGPLADAYGRKPVIFVSGILFVGSALVAWAASSLELILLARVFQGIGSAGPRVVTLAIVRDLYEGRGMAKILSFIFMIFSLVPALAPTIGHYVILAAGWRSIFLCFVAFCCFSCTWLMLRQPETLALDKRRPLEIASLMSAVKEIFATPITRLTIVIQALTFAMLFTGLSCIQPIFEVTFGRGDTFHLWFGAIALMGSTSSIINAKLVERMGMRPIIKAGFLGLSCVAIVMLGGYTFLENEDAKFAAFLLFVQASFFVAGLTLGNLNALALEPLGHIAGTASSVVSAVATVGGVIVAVAVGMAFDGTPLPWGGAITICAVLAYLLTNRIKRPGEA